MVFFFFSVGIKNQQFRGLACITSVRDDLVGPMQSQTRGLRLKRRNTGLAVDVSKKKKKKQNNK